MAQPRSVQAQADNLLSVSDRPVMLLLMYRNIFAPKHTSVGVRGQLQEVSGRCKHADTHGMHVWQRLTVSRSGSRVRGRRARACGRRRTHARAWRQSAAAPARPSAAPRSRSTRWPGRRVPHALHAPRLPGGLAGPARRGLRMSTSGSRLSAPGSLWCTGGAVQGSRPPCSARIPALRSGTAGLCCAQRCGVWMVRGAGAPSTAQAQHMVPVPAGHQQWPWLKHGLGGAGRKGTGLVWPAALPARPAARRPRPPS